MGLFTVRATLIGPTGLTEDLDLLVDTGATFSVIPTAVANRLGLRVRRQQPVLIARGRRDVWPVAEVRMAVEGRDDVPTLCFIADEGPMLLGATTLETLCLAVDPMARRLVDADAIIGASRRSTALAATPALS
jgi:predicted aspartyl protease